MKRTVGTLIVFVVVVGGLGGALFLFGPVLFFGRGPGEKLNPALGTYQLTRFTDLGEVPWVECRTAFRAPGNHTIDFVELSVPPSRVVELEASLSAYASRAGAQPFSRGTASAGYEDIAPVVRPGWFRPEDLADRRTYAASFGRRHYWLAISGADGRVFLCVSE